MDSGNSERFLTWATLARHVLGHGADIGGAVYDRGAGGGQRRLLRRGRAGVDGGAAEGSGGHARRAQGMYAEGVWGLGVSLTVDTSMSLTIMTVPVGRGPS